MHLLIKHTASSNSIFPIIILFIKVSNYSLTLRYIKTPCMLVFTIKEKKAVGKYCLLSIPRWKIIQSCVYIFFRSLSGDYSFSLSFVPCKMLFYLIVLSKE